MLNCYSSDFIRFSLSYLLLFSFDFIEMEEAELLSYLYRSILLSNAKLVKPAPDTASYPDKTYLP
jgi:hypothetical protein